MKHLSEYFRQIKNFIGNKVYALIFFMLIAGFAEGIGISLFLPVLQNGFGDDKLSQATKFAFGVFNLGYSFRIMLAMIVIFFMMRAAFLILYARYFSRVSSDLVVALRRNIMDKIFNADYLYLLSKEVGYINNAIVRETERVVNAFGAFTTVLSYAFCGTIYLILAMLLDYSAASAILVLSLLFALFVRKINILTNKISMDTSDSYARLQSLQVQIFGKLKYFKATMSDRRVSSILDKENRHLGGLRYKLLFILAIAKNAFEPLVICLVVGLLFYHVDVLKKDVSQVMFFALLFMQVGRQFLNTQTSYRKFLASMGSINTVKAFMAELDKNKEDLKETKESPVFENDIKIKGVSVVFPNGKAALEGVNMIIKPKSTVALVGHSGSGKSTVANIVTGLLRPTTGMVLYGALDYNKMNLRRLREKIGYVTQEDVVFNATIRDNISLWDQKIDQERFDRAIRAAHLSDFLKGLKYKEKEMLGENGLDISGGQRQRVTIARELYKHTELLILDEATSSLDSKTERYIYDSLKEYKGKKTMLVIAHRLSTIKSADYIYVFDSGRIVEEGPYDELIRRMGNFKKMVDDQSLTENNESRTASEKSADSINITT